jgi:hypothetical protein
MKMWLRMFFVASLAFLMLGASLPEAHAGGPMNRTFGMGLSLGNPTSITGKYHLDPTSAIDFHVGTYHHWHYRGGLWLAADYLMHVWTFVENSNVRLPFYAGIGGFMSFWLGEPLRRFDRYYSYRYDFGGGVRLPIGIVLEFQQAPFEIFFELSPALGIYHRESTGATFIRPHFIPAAIGARFYFE